MAANAFRQYEDAASSNNSAYVLYRPMYIDITGDFFAGVLLSKLAHYFHKHLTTKRNGKQWRAYSKLQWEQETGISRRRLDRVITILKKMHLIETKVMHFARLPVTHIHLHEDALSKLIVHQISATSPNDLLQHHEVVNSNSTKGDVAIKQKEGKKKVATAGSCDTPSAIASASKKSKKIKKTIGEKQPLPQEKEKVAPKEKEDQMGATIYAFKKKTGEQFGDGFQPKNASQLGSFWMYYVPLHHPTVLIENLIPKQYGQLKQIIKNLDGHPDWLMPSIRWAIEQWSIFGDLVKEQKAGSISAIPTIGSLLVHLDVAVNAHLNRLKAKAASKIVPPKVVKFVVE